MGMCSRRLELRGATVGSAWRHLFDSKIKGNGTTGRGEHVDEGVESSLCHTHPFNQLKLVHKAHGHSIGIGQGESSKHRLFVSLDPFGKDRRIGHEDVIADDLHRAAHRLRPRLPPIPIPFGQSVFDGDDRMVAFQIGPVFDHLHTGAFFALEAIVAITIEL